MKVLEALSMGVPVIATPRVAASLGIEADEGLVPARGPVAMAKAIAALLLDEPRRMKLAAAGESTVRERFGNVQISALLEQAWEDAVSTPVSRL